MVLQRVLLAAVLLITCPYLAAHFLRVISFPEFLERLRTQPEDRITLIRLNSEDRKDIQVWQNRLLDKSLQLIGPCRLGASDLPICLAPPLPHFPGSDIVRNELLMRPPPDILQVHIQQATDGEFSTVGELVDKVNANLEDLGALGDNVITLLATNFHRPLAELMVAVAIGCSPIHYDGWHEDILVSQDEQRALTAGFLFAIGDEGYFERRMTEVHKYKRSTDYQPVRSPIEESSPVKDQCMTQASRGTNRFLEKMEELDRDVIIPEEEWLRRYEEHLAVLRADLYTVADGVVPSWEFVRPTVEETISAVEEIVDGRIGRRVPMIELDFVRFLGDNERLIQYELPGLGCGLVRRVAYRRWKMLRYGQEEARLRSLAELTQMIRARAADSKMREKWLQKVWMKQYLKGDPEFHSCIPWK